MTTPRKRIKVVIPPPTPKVEVGPLHPFDPRKLPDKEFVAPDVMEPTKGWRAWAIDGELPEFGLPPKLHSVSWGYYWTPRKRSQAECSRGCDKPVKRRDLTTGEEIEVTVGIPGEHCSCGFYSAKTFAHLQGMGYHQYYPDSGHFTVVGEVANWGKVIEGTQGWRAQYAYPFKLYVPIEAAHLAAALREAYAPKGGVVLRNLLDPGEAPRRLKRLSEFEKRTDRRR
jgi:hypothetical protein